MKQDASTNQPGTVRNWTRAGLAAVAAQLFPLSRPLVALMALALLSGLPGRARDWHVAAQATGGDGSLAKPWPTLQEAVNAARQTPGPHRIVVHSGHYFNVAATLIPADSGLVIEGDQPTPPTFYGGVPLTNWQADGKFQVAPLPPSPTGKPWDIRLLLVNGEARPRSRFPATGTLPHETSFGVSWMSTTGGGWARPPAEAELTTLQYRAGDLGDWLAITNAEITVYHMWDESCVGIAAHDPTTRTLKLTPQCGHPPGAFGVKKYVLWNLQEGMTEPGQWFYDRAQNRIVYWPKAGEEMARLHVVAPTQTSILTLRGEPGRPITNVTIRGIHFAATTVPLVAGGFAAAAFEGAISLRDAHDCAFDRVVVRGVAGHGAKGSGTLRRTRIENSEITDCGAGGIYVGGEGAVIRNNHVWKVGRSYPSAIGIYQGGRDCLVSHNEVHDCSYSAINYGGVSNVVENNLIYDCMKVLHDGAAIYMFAARNCILRGNLARDITDTGGYGASAYYLDERSTGCVVENNVSLRVSWPVHNHMATNNIIRNNIFVVPGDAKLTFVRSTDFTFERNVLYAAGKIRVEGVNGVAHWVNNLFFSESGVYESVILSQYSPKTTTTNPPPNTVTENPRLQDPARGEYRLRPDSPAHRLGIQPLDVSKAGRLTP